MAGKVLIAMDDSENAMRAVEFVACHLTPDHEITIFSVFLDTAMIYDYFSPGLTPYFPTEQKSFTELEEKKRELLRKAQEKARDVLLSAGFPEKNITIKMLPRSRGVARDIVDEASAGYTTIVLGRRGLSSISEFFLGSVSQKVLHACKDTSILLVG
jgi:nucleotide-binding universal stress UspA family protein